MRLYTPPPAGMIVLPQDWTKTAKKAVFAALIAAVGVLIPFLQTKQTELAWVPVAVAVLTAVKDWIQPHYGPE